jgi:hypothetical protein
MAIKSLTRDGKLIEPARISKVLAFRGLERVGVEEAVADEEREEGRVVGQPPELRRRRRARPRRQRGRREEARGALELPHRGAGITQLCRGLTALRCQRAHGQRSEPLVGLRRPGRRRRAPGESGCFFLLLI